MNHETLQKLYELDVAEVGDKEAAKRWEYQDVMQADCSDLVTKLAEKVQELESYICNELRDLKIDTEQTKQEWPADAPEWANAAIVSYFTDAVGLTKQASQSLIERPKPAIKKIDWIKLPSALYWLKSDLRNYGKSGWIAWNCDENTRGNPLPDGLVVEWLYTDNEPWHNRIDSFFQPDWGKVTRFRIVGIQEGWE